MLHESDCSIAKAMQSPYNIHQIHKDKIFSSHYLLRDVVHNFIEVQHVKFEGGSMKLQAKQNKQTS